MTDPKLDLSDQAVRRIVSKDDDLRLRHELSVSQSSINREEIDQLERYELVGYVTLLRQLNKMTTSCRNVIAGFDPSKAVLHPKDNDLKGRSQSCSDNTESELGGATASSSGVGKSLVISDQVSHSVISTKDDSSARLELLLLSLEKSRKEERDDKEERDRKDREDRDERDRLRERKERLDREELERIKKEEREERERVRERKEKSDREELERVRKEEREERERVRERKEKLDREEREERERVRERKEKLDREDLERAKKEEREENERTKKEQREEKERIRKEELKDKEDRRLQKEQQVIADREALYERDKRDIEE